MNKANQKYFGVSQDCSTTQCDDSGDVQEASEALEALEATGKYYKRRHKQVTVHQCIKGSKTV